MISLSLFWCTTSSSYVFCLSHHWPLCNTCTCTVCVCLRGNVFISHTQSIYRLHCLQSFPHSYKKQNTSSPTCLAIYNHNSTADVLPGEVPASAEQPANVEVNVWTRPDCEGTPYENTNRTWYYFSVKGGRPSHVLRFNVMNLNRQAKLYSQGMHPVVKIGASGKWERTKDRPSYRVSNGSAF